MTPTQSIIEDSVKRDVIQDQTGRRIGVRTLGPVDTLRLYKAAGPTLSENNAWLQFAALAIAVSDIDGVPVPPPTTEGQIESIISRLGEAGINAIAHWSSLTNDPAVPDLRSSVGN